MSGSISELTEAVIDETRAAADERGVRLSLDAGDNIEISADQALITSLFLNLISNAVNYNRSGGLVKVKLTQDAGFARVEIADNGIGIAPEDLGHIFDRFYQVDKSRSAAGVGLGLSIVKWIVDVHQGNIRVDSEPGKGTTFKVSLPKEPREGKYEQA